MAPEELEQQRLAFALEQGSIAARLALPGVAIIALTAFPAAGIAGALAWAGVALLVLLLRHRLLQRARARLAGPLGLQRARRLLAGSTLALGLVVGVLPALIFPGMQQELRLVLTVIYCCWVCAGLASLGMAPHLYGSYLAVVLAGLALGWLRTAAPHAAALVGVLVLYGLVLHAFSRNIARRIAEGLAIRAENAELVHRLSLANEAKTRFMLAASHDLRQPLQAIGYLGGVLARTHDPQDARTAVKALLSAVEGLQKLFSAVLDLSRIESGALPARLVPFQLEALVGRLDAEYRALCVASGRPWECRVESAAVLSDPALLERVLRNLLDNAVKHGCSGPVRLALALAPAAVLIRVSDTGPGIPAHERGRVFDEFYRGAAGAGQPGLGLGLSIVRRLADRLGCQVEIGYTDAQAQVGTTVALRVPRAQPASPEALGSAELEPADQASEGEGREEREVQGLAVLVIDDDAAVLEATRALLDRWQCRVATCAGAPTLEATLAAFGAPDVALVDYHLGGAVDGLALAASLRQRHPDMGVVMVTAETGTEARAQLAEAGLPVLEKPVSPRELRLTLGLFRAAGQ